MYLKSFTIENYRKFGKENNTVCFAKNSKDKGLIGSTLVIGQNNAGKTSVVTALKKSSGSESLLVNDFNFNYLYGVLEFFYKNISDIKAILIDNGESSEEEKKKLLLAICPYMKFCYQFQMDIKDENSDELLTNIAPLIKNDLDEEGVVSAYVKYELKERLVFVYDFYSYFSNKSNSEETFGEFIEFLTKGNYFEINIYTDYDCSEKVTNFSMNKLVKVNTVSFEKLHSSGRLSDAFNKIYNYKATNNPEVKNALESQVKGINKDIDSAVSINKELTEKVNTAVEKTLDSSNAAMLLKSNLTIESLLRNVIKYVYKDGKFEIPEDQFGMGYTNLMLIIAELVDYVDNSPESLFRNTINLFIIEEPESYMHPQMQKLFIKNLNDAIEVILSEKNVQLNLICQLIITSHSANILHGKLHTEDTFDNINYISAVKGISDSSIISLNDSSIIPNKDKNSQRFNFLKKHIEYNCCELFFADACIVVEGDAEETILPFYIEKSEFLSKKYISILNINGAYAHTFKNLFKTLQIPIVIITDIDIEGASNCNEQIKSIDKKTTTNSTLNDFGFNIGTDFRKEDKNILIVTQNKTGEYYPTSFEEAIILSNWENNTVKKTLSQTLPQIYKEHEKNIMGSSHLFQNKLGSNSKKGLFAINLLYNMLNLKDGEDIPVLPEYIDKSLKYISNALNPKEETANE